MTNIIPYHQSHETDLIALLRKEPDWVSFINDDAIATFKAVLLATETYLCESDGYICGYIRAIVDGFGVYVSELYVAPQYRGNGFGAALLKKIKQEFPTQNVYVLSDEDAYYEKLGYQRVGSVYQL